MASSCIVSNLSSNFFDNFLHYQYGSFVYHRGHYQCVSISIFKIVNNQPSQNLCSQTNKCVHGTVEHYMHSSGSVFTDTIIACCVSF